MKPQQPHFKFLDPNVDIGEIAQIIFQNAMEDPQAVAWFIKAMSQKNPKAVFVSAFTAGVGAALHAIEDGKLRPIGKG